MSTAGPDRTNGLRAPPRPLRKLGKMRSATMEEDGPNVSHDGRVIPIPDVPVEPVLSLAAFLDRRASPVPSILHAGRVVNVVAGRTAIAQALACMGLEPGATVLVPAYHCMSMVEPLSYVEAVPRFFRVRPDLSVDLADVEAKIDASVRAVMVTHYFGLPQDMAPIRALCDRHGLLLLEDCAHCFFGDIHGRPPGGWGDFAIASQRKFFPIFDGGLLVSRREEINRIRLVSQGTVQNLRAAYNMVEMAVLYDRLTLLAPLMRAIEHLRGHGNRDAEPPEELASGSIGPAQSNSGAAGGFAADWVDKRPTLASRVVRALASSRYIVDRRREVYTRFAAAFADLAGCRVLQPALPDGAVPYTFPLRFESLSTVFPALEDAAVPMQRFGQFLWPSVDATTCATSVDLSHHAVQISCHQEMTDREIDSIIARVRYVAETAPGRREPRRSQPAPAPSPAPSDQGHALVAEQS